MNDNHITIALSPFTEQYNIKSIEDKSDSLYARCQVHFENGYQLSIIRGLGSYGNQQGLFEIAIFSPDDKYCPDLLEGDDVLGYQTAAQVVIYVEKVGDLK